MHFPSEITIYCVFRDQLANPRCRWKFGQGRDFRFKLHHFGMARTRSGCQSPCVKGHVLLFFDLKTVFFVILGSFWTRLRLCKTLLTRLQAVLDNFCNLHANSASVFFCVVCRCFVLSVSRGIISANFRSIFSVLKICVFVIAAVLLRFAVVLVRVVFLRSAGSRWSVNFCGVLQSGVEACWSVILYVLRKSMPLSWPACKEKTTPLPTLLPTANE